MRYNIFNMIQRVQTNRGLVKTIVIFVLALIIISYLGLNIKSIVASQTFQDNWTFIKDLAINIWSNYLKGIIDFIWNNIITPILKKI